MTVDPRRAIDRRHINAVLERSWEWWRDTYQPECHLCWAWLPYPPVDASPSTCRCTGCGASYTSAGSGSWRRFLTPEDAQNPWHSALHMRRYGITAEYVRVLGWVVPPEWMTVRFPGEPVAA